MRVEQLGEGTPEIAVIAAIHGDEPCGVRAVERLLAERPTVERPVKFVIANEEAVERDVRYVDEDLNRAFPGDPRADTHERRLAAELERELDGCLALSLHSTQSYAEPFAIVDGVSPDAAELCSQLPIDAVVEAGEFIQGRLFTAARSVEVECGLQGTDSAAENAYRLIRAFLAATGVLDEETTKRDVPVYRLQAPVSKDAADEYEVFVENFELVASGEAFAAADDAEIVAEDEFYPVLMSAYGYEHVFGYAAEAMGTLDAS